MILLMKSHFFPHLVLDYVKNNFDRKREDEYIVIVLLSFPPLLPGNSCFTYL